MNFIYCKISLLSAFILLFCSQFFDARKDKALPNLLDLLDPENSSRYRFTYEGKLMNLIYIKLPKVGSSTVGGIARRIAAHYGLNGYESNEITQVNKGGSKLAIKEPLVFANHMQMSSEEDFLATLKFPLFYFTWVRDPVDRCLSEFYHFQVSRKSIAPTYK